MKRSKHIASALHRHQPIAQFCTVQSPNAPGVGTSTTVERQQHQPSQTSSARLATTQGPSSGMMGVGGTPTLRAEVLWILKTITEHHSYSLNEGISELFKAVFPDSEVATAFSCGKNKMSYITKFGLAPYITKELVKDVNELEEDLKCGVEAWEKVEGSPFLMEGQRVMEYISKQWEEHRSQKDKEKNERMSKKADSTQFKTPNKRPHGAANTSVTPSKMRKTPNQLLLRTNMISSSTSSMSSTFVCVPGKPPISAKRVKTSEASSAPRTPLQEFNSDKNLDPFSYSDFTHELSRKAHHDAVMNSTVKDVVL